MKSKKDLIEVILLGVIATVLIIGLFLTANHYKKTENDNKSQNNTTESKENFESNEKEGEENLESEDPITETPIPSQNPEKDKTPSKSPISTPKQTPNNNPQPKETEEDVVAYFNSLERSVAMYSDETNPTLREKAKSAFTTTVDFLFYDKQIKGHTFKELTSTAKLKVIQAALKIDNKIDTYFPNYKNTIKEKMQDLKGKAALLYLETTSKLCESVGESACNEAREDFKTMKESFGFTWDIIKNAASSSYRSLKTILSEWYQSIK